MFGIASSTAQESMLEQSLLTALVYAGVSRLSKCDGVFSNSKGLVFWNGESSARAIQSTAEEEPRKKGESVPFKLQNLNRSLEKKNVQMVDISSLNLSWAATSSSTQGRFLIQEWPCQPDPRTSDVFEAVQIYLYI